MADVAPPHRSLRQRLGFGSSKYSNHQKKLIRKSNHLDDAEQRHDSFSSPIEAYPVPLDAHINQSNGVIKDEYAISALATIGTHNTTHRDPIKSPSSSHQPPRRLKKEQPSKKDPSAILDRDTGERKDLTEMLHSFSYVESPEVSEETLIEVASTYDDSLPDGTAILARGSPEIWTMISTYLSPLDVANLSLTCHTLYVRLGPLPYNLLVDPANRDYRVDFLLTMDRKLPGHLFCFACNQWHIRTQVGHEFLKPANTLNPLFNCPNRTNHNIRPPRMRITEGRTLPFTFVQLAKRAFSYGPAYGVPVQSLARRWKDTDSEWSHESTYYIGKNGHVMMRVKSQVFVQAGMTPAAKRLLLFSRGDYTPYFSVCAHWRYGILTSIPKCALNHIPVPKVNALTTLRTQKAVGSVNLCGECRPMRRCLECPTEYLIELKLVEDKQVRSNGPERFKQALVVTRWSDLGAARSPEDKEWAAIVGNLEGYDSFTEIGRRAISGTFEGAFSETIPGQRILSMNPHGIRKDEEWNGWY